MSVPLSIPQDKDPFVLPKDATAEDKAKRFYNAGVILDENQQAKFSDGSVWSERELYLKAIELKKDFADPFHNLGACLDAGETIRLPGSDVDWTQQALYITAISLVTGTNRNQQEALYWMNLSISINAQDRVTFPDGSVWDERMLLIKSLELSDKDPDAFYHLAKTYQVDNTERLKFPDGRDWTVQDLYKKVLDLDSKYALAYYELSKSVEEGEQVTLNDGKKFSSKELLETAMKLDPDLIDDVSSPKGGA